MSGSRSGAPLAYLWRAKLVGRLRDLRRRLASPLGALTLLVGVLLIGGWAATIVFRSSIIERTGDPPSLAAIRLGLALYLAFVTLSALSVRGLYLPRAEVERLLAAPISRASIVRFRAATSIFASLPFVALMAVFLSPRFASPEVAAVALLLVVPTTTVYGQGVSLLAAPTSGRLDRILGRVPESTLRLVGILGVLSVFLALGLGPGLESEGAAERRAYLEQFAPGRADGEAPDVSGEAAPRRGAFEGFANAPPVSALTLPLQPWARALAAPDMGAAAPWLALLALLFVCALEGVARLPIDYRMSAVRTSEAFERRLARARRGQVGASAMDPSKRARGLRVPWLAGRSRFGALVWVRVAWLVRQSRGALLVAALVAVVGLVVGTRLVTGEGAETGALAVLGVVYLSSGLRADFRNDLDRMESMRAWPVRPASLFVATVLPGALLTAAVIGFVLVVRATLLGHDVLTTAAFAAAIPPVAYGWAAVDNAVFLLFPARFVPGQGSAIQHAGRGFLLVLLRGAILLMLLAVAGGGALQLERYLAPTAPELAPYAAVLWAIVVGVCALVLVTAFGAWALRRYDVSRVPPAS